MLTLEKMGVIGGKIHSLAAALQFGATHCMLTGSNPLQPPRRQAGQCTNVDSSPVSFTQTAGKRSEHLSRMTVSVNVLAFFHLKINPPFLLVDPAHHLGRYILWQLPYNLEQHTAC